VPSLVVAVPVRYAHSHSGVIDLHDLYALRRLVWALLERLDENTVRERITPWERD
jgi:putative aminopeptidase FrvX